jgi:hypothetical protein
MKNSIEKLESYLEKNGWQIEGIENDDLEWWADEIWEMRSIWSPEGVPVYITFLVDPQHEGNRNKGQSVWGIGNSSNYPISRVEAESNGTVSMNDIFKNNVNDFFQRIESLRSGAINDIGL